MGCEHPDKLLRKLTARQWEEWRRFDEVEPLGEWRADARNLSLWQRLAEVFCGQTPGERIWPTFPYVEKKRTPEESWALICALNEEEARKREEAAREREQE